ARVPVMDSHRCSHGCWCSVTHTHSKELLLHQIFLDLEHIYAHLRPANQTNTHTHTHTHAHSHLISLQTHTQPLLPDIPHAHSHTHIQRVQTHSLANTLSHTHTHTHTDTAGQADAHTHATT